MPETSGSNRTLPSNSEAEQSVIGAMLLFGDLIDDAAEMLTKEDFYYPELGIIFECLVELKNSNRTIDFVNIIDSLNAHSAPPSVCDVQFLKNLKESVSYTVNIKEHAEIVSRKSLLRNIIKMNKEIEKVCYEESMDIEEILDKTERGLMNVLQKHGAGEAMSIDQIVQKALDDIVKAYDNKGGISGISTGFDDLDNMTSGLQNSDMVLVAARPSMGKTAFALTIAANVAFKQDLSVVIFSLEMSEVSLMKRLLSMEAGIEASKLRDGDLSDYDWTPLMESAASISNSKLIIDEANGITMTELRSRCRKYKQQNDIKLIVIDYLQLINGSGNVPRQQEISDISRAIKSVARELDVPVIAISQLNRGAELREEKRPMLSDLRDSGAIEQDADVVMLIYRDDYYNKDSKDKGISEIIIAKQRNGPTGTVQLAWLDRYTRFENRRNPRNRISED